MSTSSHQLPNNVVPDPDQSGSAVGKVVAEALASAREMTASALVAAARGFEIAAQKIALHRPAVDEVVQYLKYGRTSPSTGAAVPSALRHVDTGVVAYGGRFLKLDHVDRHPNFLLPRLEEAHVTLRVVDDPKRADDKVRTPDGEMVPYALGEVNFVFTSALSFATNMREFVAFLSSAPQAPEAPCPTSPETRA